MKKIIRSAALLMSAFIIAGSVSACSGNIRDDAKNVESTAESKMNDVQSEVMTEMSGLGNTVTGAVTSAVGSLKAAYESVKSKVAAALGADDAVTSEKVREAVDFIDSHIDDSISDMSTDLKEKFIYYAEYLRQIGEKAYGDRDDDIKSLGKKATDLAGKLIDDENADISELRSEIKRLLETIKSDPDNSVNGIVDNYKN